MRPPFHQVTRRRPMTERFIPHGQRCEADDGRGSDFGRCHEPAYGVVVHEGRERYVCHFHQQHYKSGDETLPPQEPR
jgi:hypothetical protein